MVVLQPKRFCLTLPLILNRKTDELKSKYLIDLCKELYLKDIEERYNLRGDNVMATMVNILASAVGSLTNPTKLANIFAINGIRNAQLNFRQQEENHIMENIIYNELLVRGFNVDVGVVEHIQRDENGKSIRKRLEVDFVCNKGNQRYYIQSAFAIPDSEKMEQEQKSLVNIADSFKKIIVVKDRIKLWRSEKGIVVIGILDFLLNPNNLDL